ncbi:MAG: hypothetical protein LBD07_02000 [Spirochaetaceae bacterium]|jgi:predicted AAA+ superfamily ATPase|nr:hypothetical protein [Spirochaetaceae bacterium]
MPKTTVTTKKTQAKPAKKTTFEDMWLAIERPQALIDRRLGNRLGDIMESLMVPDLVAKFGYDFSKMSRNNKIKDFVNDIIMEIDALLENGDCAMAVEVKVNLSVEDVKDHITRMEKLRKYAALHGDKRKFYAAVAAAVINEDTRTFALKQGFYVIELSGENITVTEPFVKPRAF